MGSFATSLFASGIRPASAVLTGIAATIHHESASVGDVPVASEMLAADDIKLSKGKATFRQHGFQVDHHMSNARKCVTFPAA